MPVTTASVTDLARSWGDRNDISARSVLVTILGDTVVPLGGTVWLSDLIAMAEPFGFNERLVRTSMFRLVSERWVENERMGRRSRYSLTPFGRNEFAVAESRIYHRRPTAWDGTWTLAFVGNEPEAELTRHLGWHGFAEIAKGVLALPRADVTGTRQVVDGLEVEPAPMIATAHFTDAGPVADIDSFRTGSGLDRAEAAYRDFVDRYGWTGELPDALDRLDSFALRTMLVHDLRRARLNDPELPNELLPTDWVGTRAMALAGPAYAAVDDAAWQWVESVTGLRPTTTHHRHRFRVLPTHPEDQP